MNKIILSFSLAVLMAGCNPSKKNTQAPSRQPLPDFGYDTLKMTKAIDIQGHRGCRGLMPENTIPAMVHALGMGVTTLEMDIVITKDKKVILSHEPFFNHEIATKPDGSFVAEAEEKSLNIYRMNYDEVIKYDVGMKPHPRFPKQEKMKAIKPLLSDVFKFVKKYMTRARRPFPYYNIETKCLPIGDKLYHPEPAEIIELLMAVIRENEVEDFVIIQSFDFRTLQYLHKKYPNVKSAMLIEDNDNRTLDEQLKVLGFIPGVYSPHYSLVTSGLLDSCHSKGMKVIPWTVNEKEKIAALTKLGVDGIITDYPDLFN